MDSQDMRQPPPNAWNNDRRAWHLDKTISVGHLLSTLVIAISVFSWASAVDRRVEQNSLEIGYLKSEQVQEQQRLSSVRNEIRAEFRALAAKLDRLIEKQINK